MSSLIGLKLSAGSQIASYSSARNWIAGNLITGNLIAVSLKMSPFSSGRSMRLPKSLMKPHLPPRRIKPSRRRR